MQRLILAMMTMVWLVAGCTATTEIAEVADRGPSDSAADEVIGATDAGDATSDPSDDGDAVEDRMPEPEPDGARDEPVESDTPDDTEPLDDEGAGVAPEETMAGSSPLGAAILGDADFDTALGLYTAQVEARVSDCMADRGFPFVASEAPQPDPVREAQSQLTEREWTGTYGYGISTSFDVAIARVGQGADPNLEVIFTLEPAEREDWLEALFGDGTRSFGVDAAAGVIDERGCVGQAVTDMGGAEIVDRFRSFGEAYASGHADILASDDMTGAIQEWSSCMNEFGFDYRHIGGPEADIDVRLDTIVGPMLDQLDALDPTTARAIFFDDPVRAEDFPELDLAALRELQRDELRIAVADLDCFDANVRAVYTPRRDEFEQGLVAEYVDLLNALKALVG